ncbi:hypothetical protein QR680_009612 [Steinernema hermaphroditum]|uniref:Cytochrome b561 domain-containing protein n=1 Tax=Steinernema hermaphroditum TaxID=289476 RepID=A0AA39IL05_9BILA|nr:hypothetical protein QR680_009612 [Steinernema hermaphroditum]
MDPFNETTTPFGSPSAPFTSPGWKRQLPKLHGCCFVLAFFCLLPVASGFARYFRDCLTSYTPGGLRLWFHVHRALNILAVVLMVFGLLGTLISHDFVWTGPKVGAGAANASPTAIHTIFGLFAVILAWTQPLNVLLRCGPNHRLRPHFNWSHRSIGVVAWLLAAVSNMIACKCFFWDFIDAPSAVATCAFVFGVVGSTAVLVELIAYRIRTVDVLPEKTHWKALQVIIFTMASTLLVVLSTILCVLIVAKPK